MNKGSHYKVTVMFMFCCIGVEKNNEVARRNARSSNKWDLACDIIRTENRLHVLEHTKREKRKYDKVMDTDCNYWTTGIIECRKKRAKLGQ